MLVSCYCLAPDRKTASYKKWIAKAHRSLDVNRRGLRKMDVQVMPTEFYDTGWADECFAQMPLYDLLNIWVLGEKNFESVVSSLKQRLLRFTDKLTGPKGIIPPYFG